MIRTTPVAYGIKPYVWDVTSVYQCTWYGYYRALEEGKPAPTYWDRPTKTGSYPNAKLWLENRRDPWEAITDLSYTPKPGDIAVFDGQYGHIQYMETDVMYSEYRSGDPSSFSIGKFEKSSHLLGFLHYPYNSIEPVERNTNVDQIQTTDDTLRIRTKPSLSADVVGHVQKGYYNIIAQKKSDGFTWYQLATDRWCADISVIYLPGEDDDLKQLERIFNTMRTTIQEKDEELNRLNTKLKKIKEICDG